MRTKKKPLRKLSNSILGTNNLNNVLNNTVPIEKDISNKVNLNKLLLFLKLYNATKIINT